jgi:hypothetical protein
MHRTLHWFCTNSQRLRRFSRTHNIKPGQHVIIVGRSGRVRVFKVEEDGTHKVELCEFDTQRLSVEVAVFAHFQKQASGEMHDQIGKLKDDADLRRRRRIEYRRKMAARNRED